MGNTLTVRNLVIGEGMPKICVPVTGTTAEDITAQAERIKGLQPDLVEWRADFFEEVEQTEAVLAVLARLRGVLPDTPLIFTFRTAKEGGERELGAGGYAALNEAAATSGYADIVDVELFAGDDVVERVRAAAHRHGVRVIVSSHDFGGTPDVEEMVARLRRAQELGGDLPKLAVMPRDAGDVLALLQATWTMKERYADRPIITMSMAGAGVVSRMAGGIFGSAVTFGSAGKPSAPGQLGADELRGALELLHRGL